MQSSPEEANVCCVSHSAPGGNECCERGLWAAGTARPEWQADERIGNDRVSVSHVWTRGRRAQHAECSCQCSTVCRPSAQLDTQCLRHVSPYTFTDMTLNICDKSVLTLLQLSPYTFTGMTLSVCDKWVLTHLQTWLLTSISESSHFYRRDLSYVWQLSLHTITDMTLNIRGI